MPPGPLNYEEADFRRIRELSGGPFEVPEDLRRVLDGIGYMEDWRTSYRVQSVKSSLHAPRITCIDSAILAYGLLELLFSGVKRRLLAIHRRDPVSGEECGHCVALDVSAADEPSQRNAEHQHQIETVLDQRAIE